eukprot:3038608-Prymnesium_polylepis.1
MRADPAGASHEPGPRGLVPCLCTQAARATPPLNFQREPWAPTTVSRLKRVSWSCRLPGRGRGRRRQGT